MVKHLEMETFPMQHSNHIEVSDFLDQKKPSATRGHPIVEIPPQHDPSWYVCSWEMMRLKQASYAWNVNARKNGEN